MNDPPSPSGAQSESYPSHSEAAKGKHVQEGFSGVGEDLAGQEMLELGQERGKRSLSQGRGLGVRRGGTLPRGRCWMNAEGCENSWFAQKTIMM